MKLSHALQGFWLEKRQRFSANTVRNYGYVFRYFQEFLGDVEFESIQSVDIRRFLEHLATERKYSKRSVHDTLIPLSSLWTWAEKELETKHIIRKRIEEPTYPPVLIDPQHYATGQSFCYCLTRGFVHPSCVL